MHVGAKIRDRLGQVGMSQSELARRTSLNQSTIAGLISGKARSSAHLHRIARELGTTPAYLTGETDDPDANAPPPPPEPHYQLASLAVMLPSEAALARMFEAQLQVYPDLRGVELARALAKRLPGGLQRLAAARLAPASVPEPDDDEADQPLDEAPPEPRRAQRT